MRIIVRRNGPAGYPQLFLLDPEPQHHRDQRSAITVTSESTWIATKGLFFFLQELPIR